MNLPLIDSVLENYQVDYQPPIALYEEGTFNYVVFGASTVNRITGYVILRITDAIPQSVDQGFLLEEDRVLAGDIDIRSDSVGTLALINAITTF